MKSIKGPYVVPQPSVDSAGSLCSAGGCRIEDLVGLPGLDCTGQAAQKKQLGLILGCLLGDQYSGYANNDAAR